MSGLLLAALLACGTADDCTSDPCLVAAVGAALREDPEGARGLLEPLDMPRRTAIALAVVESQPGRARVLCATLAPASTREWCEAVATRPHLTAPAPTVPVGRTAFGPATADTVVPDALGFGPTTGTATVGESAAHVREARAAAGQGDVEGAAAACAMLPAGRWAWECNFLAAEARLTGVMDYTAATGLCLRAGEFRGHCVDHLTHTLAEQAAPVTPSADDWTGALAGAEAVTRTWGPVDGRLSADVVDRYWSDVLRRTYLDADAVSGDPLDTLPSEVAVHVRAAAAARLLELEAEMLGTRGLDEWVDRLLAGLERRDATIPAPTRRRHAPMGLGRWTEDRDPQDRGRPAVHFAVSSRRTFDADARVDATICVLEAAARLPRTDPLVSQGLGDASPAVQWTARRLLHEAAPVPGPHGVGR